MSPRSFQPYVAGSAVPDEAPRTPKDVPHRGGAANPSEAALRARFGDAVARVDVVWGETTVAIDGVWVEEIVSWLKEDAAQL